jgi:hypothetical protein
MTKQAMAEAEPLGTTYKFWNNYLANVEYRKIWKDLMYGSVSITTYKETNPELRSMKILMSGFADALPVLNSINPTSLTPVNNRGMNAMAATIAESYVSEAYIYTLLLMYIKQYFINEPSLVDRYTAIQLAELANAGLNLEVHPEQVTEGEIPTGTAAEKLTFIRSVTDESLYAFIPKIAFTLESFLLTYGVPLVTSYAVSRITAKKFDLPIYATSVGSEYASNMFIQGSNKYYLKPLVSGGLFGGLTYFMGRVKKMNGLLFNVAVQSVSSFVGDMTKSVLA